MDGKQKSFTSGSIRYSSTSSSHQLARESRDDVAAISSCFRRPKTAVCSLFIVKGYLNRFESGLIQNKRFEMHEEDLKKKNINEGNWSANCPELTIEFNLMGARQGAACIRVTIKKVFDHYHVPH